MFEYCHPDMTCATDREKFWNWNLNGVLNGGYYKRSRKELETTAQTILNSIMNFILAIIFTSTKLFSVFSNAI